MRCEFRGSNGFADRTAMPDIITGLLAVIIRRASMAVGWPADLVMLYLAGAYSARIRRRYFIASAGTGSLDKKKPDGSQFATRR